MRVSLILENPPAVLIVLVGFPFDFAGLAEVTFFRAFETVFADFFDMLRPCEAIRCESIQMAPRSHQPR